MSSDLKAGAGVGATADQPSQYRERARRARAIATRYRGEAANVLIEIADDFEARAARLERPALVP
jgi:hypothetical protein